jgi:hypothetical protein
MNQVLFLMLTVWASHAPFAFPLLFVQRKLCSFYRADTTSWPGKTKLNAIEMDGEYEVREVSSTAHESEINRKKKIMQWLIAHRDEKRNELLTADMAITQAQEELEAVLSNSAGSQVALVATYDYGFSSKSGSPLKGFTGAGGSTVPKSAFVLAGDNFKRELRALISSIRSDSIDQDEDSEHKERRKKLSSMGLSNDAIWKRKADRPEVEAPWIIKAPYYLLCFLLDFLFDGKPISRFYFLETVARMPYFSYISMLHAY